MVPQANPVIAPPLSDTAEVPEPTLSKVVALPYKVVVPYSNNAVVEAPRGFTVPLKVAPVGVMPTANPVDTVGGQDVVANVASRPFVVPPTFDATTRK